MGQTEEDAQDDSENDAHECSQRKGKRCETLKEEEHDWSPFSRRNDDIGRNDTLRNVKRHGASALFLAAKLEVLRDTQLQPHNFCKQESVLLEERRHTLHV